MRRREGKSVDMPLAELLSFDPADWAEPGGRSVEEPGEMTARAGRWSAARSNYRFEAGWPFGLLDMLRQDLETRRWSYLAEPGSLPPEWDHGPVVRRSWQFPNAHEYEHRVRS